MNEHDFCFVHELLFTDCDKCGRRFTIDDAIIPDEDDAIGNTVIQCAYCSNIFDADWHRYWELENEHDGKPVMWPRKKKRRKRLKPKQQKALF